MSKKKRVLSLLMVVIFALSSMVVVMGDNAVAEPLVASCCVVVEVDVVMAAEMQVYNYGYATPMPLWICAERSWPYWPVICLCWVLF